MKSIDNIKEKIKGAVELSERRDIFMALLVIGVAAASFGLGRLSAITSGTSAVKIQNVAGVGDADFTQTVEANTTTGQTATASVSETGQKVYVASKNGTKYHYIWCSGAQTIAEANKIYFATPEEARAAGYTPAANCKGLK